MNHPWIVILGLVLGGIIGSFLATVAIRWPQGKSIAQGRSACDRCGTTIKGYDLIPMLSYCILGGRCRSCKARIRPLHLLIEAICAMVGALSFALFPTVFALQAAVLGWLLVLLASLDLTHFWLPNRLTYGLAAAGLVSSALPGGIGLETALAGLLAGLVALWSIGAVFRRVRSVDGIGGGDPKLFGAIGAWTGWTALPYIMLAASLAGIGLALVYRGRTGELTQTTRIAFGACLAFAAWPIWVGQNLLLQ